MTGTTAALQRAEGFYWVEIKALPSPRWVIAEWSHGYWTVPGWVDEAWDDGDLDEIDELRLVRLRYSADEGSPAIIEPPDGRGPFSNVPNREPESP